MSYKKIVFIDPGTTMGYAVVDDNKLITSPEHYFSGSENLSKDPGLRVVNFWNALKKIIGADPIETQDNDGILVAWEEAAFSRYHTASRMYGMWEGLLLHYCEMHKVAYLAVNQSSIKSYCRKSGYLKDYDTVNGKRVKVKGKRAKPSPREIWKLTSEKNLREHEIDARWGLEYVIANVRTGDGICR